MPEGPGRDLDPMPQPESPPEGLNLARDRLEGNLQSGCDLVVGLLSSLR
jgi:hypothetical protein